MATFQVKGQDRYVIYRCPVDGCSHREAWIIDQHEPAREAPFCIPSNSKDAPLSEEIAVTHFDELPYYTPAVRMVVEFETSVGESLILRA